MNSVERRLRDAKLGAAIDNAIANLPKDFTIEICLERNSVVVQIVDPQREVTWEYDVDEDDGYIYELIDSAVQQAIEDSEKGEENKPND